jgi:hypothetical protein
MSIKRTMALNLTDPEMAAPEELSLKKDMTKTAMIRQALRLYATIDARILNGEKSIFEDEKQGKKAEILVL